MPVHVPAVVSDRFESLQALRGVAALLVVILHACVTLEKYGSGAGTLFGDFRIGHSGIDLFFVLSGFLMMWTTAGRRGSAAEAWSFLKRRVVRVYPTYWLYFILVFAAVSIRPEWVNSSAAAHASLFKSFFLLPDEGMTLVMVAWTLEYEVFFYALFGLAMFVSIRNRLAALLGSISLLVAAGFVLPSDTAEARVMLSPMLLEFAIGAVLGAMHARRKWPHGKVYLAAGVLMLAAEGLGHSWLSLLGVSEGSLSRPLTYGLASALVVHGACAWEKSGRFPCPWMIRKIGDSSYTLYLSHILVLSALGRVWASAGMNRFSDDLFITVLIFASVLFGLIAYEFAEKPLAAKGRDLIRGRERRQYAPV